jgi:hypothetical protein
MRSWGIYRPSRHLKRRLTTQTGEIPPEGGVRTAACSSGSGTGKMRGGLSPRPKAYQSGMVVKSF